MDKRQKFETESSDSGSDKTTIVRPTQPYKTFHPNSVSLDLGSHTIQNSAGDSRGTAQPTLNKARAAPEPTEKMTQMTLDDRRPKASASAAPITSLPSGKQLRHKGKLPERPISTADTSTPTPIRPTNSSKTTSKPTQSKGKVTETQPASTDEEPSATVSGPDVVANSSKAVRRVSGYQDMRRASMNQEFDAVLGDVNELDAAIDAAIAAGRAEVAELVQQVKDKDRRIEELEAQLASGRCRDCDMRRGDL